MNALRSLSTWLWMSRNFLSDTGGGGGGRQTTKSTCAKGGAYQAYMRVRGGGEGGQISANFERTY